MTRKMLRPNVCQVRICRNSRNFDFSRFDEILHVQVLHFHVSCTLGQTLSLCQCSCCLGVTSQIDLGLHAECFHVQSVCASCSERVELALSAALSVRVLQLCVHPMVNPSVLVNTDVDFVDFVSQAQSASVNTSIFRGLSCTVRNSHPSLCPSVVPCTLFHVLHVQL